MPARLHPGVYVEEVPGGARAIEAAGTSWAIFVGETERGPIAPTKIKGIVDYERQFGGHWRPDAAGAVRAPLRYALQAFFGNGGTTAYVLRAIAAGADTAVRDPVMASSPGVWGNALRVVFADSSDGTTTRWRFFVIYTPPGGTASIVERWDKLSADPADENYAPDVLLRSNYIRWNPTQAVAKPAINLGMAVPAPPALPTPIPDELVLAIPVADADLVNGTFGDADLSAADIANLLPALDEVNDASLLVVPARYNDTAAEVSDKTTEALAYVANRPKQDIFCVADLPRQTSASVTQAVVDTKVAFTGLGAPTNFGAVYWPWVEIGDPVGVGRDPTIVVGPAAFVAGIYSRIDQRRGVWKAPAGLEATVLGARRLDYKMLDAHQDDLNPFGINALRALPVGGNVVWGTRTMEPSTEWRYVSVRRTAIFIRMSIYNGIQWAAFEPNDEPLWAQLRLTIGGFMEQLFRQGAFAGRTAREAFFVKCDTETTPEADQVAGIVNVLVGFAPLRPAEFVVVKLSQIVNQKA